MSARVIPTRSRILATKSRARDAVLHRVGPELVEHVLTFVDDTDDAYAACVSKLWADTRRAWSVALQNCDLTLNTNENNGTDNVVIAFAQDGASIAVGATISEDVGSAYLSHGVVALIDARTGRLLWRKQELSNVGCTNIDMLEFTPEGALAVACYDDDFESILVLDAASGAIRRRLFGCGCKMMFSGGILASLDMNDESIVLIDWASGEVRHRIERNAEPDCVALTTAGGSTTLAVADEKIGPQPVADDAGGGKITFYDAATGDQLREFEVPNDSDHTYYHHSNLAFSRDGSFYALWQMWSSSRSSRGGAMTAVYDALTNELLWQKSDTTRGYRECPRPAVLFSHDGSLLLAPCCDDDESIALYDVATGDLRRRLRFPEMPSFMAFSPDDQTCAATISNLGDPRLLLYDVSTGELRRKSR
mmetsp:Transcript_23476/g.70372  ORF Transcript_23476/g.70372 Transcript_23476/m.70372 type:complete len:421 (-) Transcript_23476:53-1315(-)